MSEAIIKIEGLRKAYAGGVEALKGVDLDIRKGEILALLGPNGAGKTTLISIVCGIVTPSGGTVTVGGHDNQSDYRAARSLILDQPVRSGQTILHLEGDITINKEWIEYHVKKCDVVLPLVAIATPATYVREPLRVFELDFVANLPIVRACVRYKKRIVFPSTSEVYGDHREQRPLDEEARRLYGPTTARRWAYADSKAMDEFLALAYHQERGLDCIIARLFNTVGPRQSAQYGMVIPNFVERALAGEPLEVHGDGSQTRCFCHVSDTIRALAGLMDAPSSGEIFNVGSQESIGILDLAERVRSMTGSSSEIVHVPYHRVYGVGIEDMLHRIPSTEKIRAAIGWQPSLSLDKILADVIEHLDDPVAAIGACTSLLAEGGALCVVTPDPASATARLAGDRWWGLVPAHTCLLPRRTLRELLAAEGLVISQDVPLVRSFELRYWLAGLSERGGTAGKALRALARTPAGRRRVSLSLGDERVEVDDVEVVHERVGELHEGAAKTFLAGHPAKLKRSGIEADPPGDDVRRQLAERPSVDRSYAFALQLKFDDIAAHDAYQIDPVHKAFHERCKNYWSKALVYDFVDPDLADRL